MKEQTLGSRVACAHPVGNPWQLQALEPRLLLNADTLATAVTCGLLNGSLSYSDTVNASDRNDYYRFDVASTRSATVTLTGLAGNADINLLDSAGATLAYSRQTGKANESIVRSLTAGTYYVQVYAAGDNTRYTLGLSSAYVAVADGAGNTQAAAKAVSALSATPAVFSDYVGNGDPNDYYSFTLAVRSDFTANLTGLVSDADMGLLNSKGQTVVASQHSGMTAESIAQTLDAGVYSIRVYPYSGSTNYSLSLAAVANMPPPDNAGNTPATARDIGALGTTVSFSDYVGTLDANDYYRFTVAASSNVTIAMNGLTADADMSLLNSAGAVIVTSNKSGTTAESIAQTVAAGAYYVRVYPYSGSTNYTLSLAAVANVPPPDNAGNALATARDIGALGTAVSFSDYVGTLDANDYYRFTVALPSNVTLAMNGLTSDADMSLLNSAGTVIVTSSKSGTTAESIASTLDAGTYYIRVYPYSGSTNYTLTASAARADAVAPTAALNASSVAYTSATATFTVSYADNYALNVATLDGNDIVVSGPGGFTAAAAFVSVNVNSNGTARTATYSFSAPGGTWDTADTGTYTISLQAGQVSDTSGNFAAAASLGTFAYPAPPAPPSDWFSTNLHDAGLIAAARTAYADSTFTRTEMITVLGASGSDDGIVDATELADMRTLVAASTLSMADYVRVLASKVVNADRANSTYQGAAMGNLAAGDTQAKLTNLINKWFFGLDHPVASGTYVQAAGSLFVSGISYTDIVQGAVGDCYFVAALAEVAQRSPTTIQNMFIDNGDNTWTVRFYHNGVSDYVTVDRYLPVNSSGRLIYAGYNSLASSTSTELWVALAEKAFAQLNQSGWTGEDGTNSYNGISGGWPNVSLTQITGIAATSTSLGSASMTAIVNAWNAGRLVTIGTQTHAYALVNYNATTQVFTIYNPWGTASDYTWAQVLSTFVDWQYTLS